ncbi:NAD-dependent epimerase/dehydratase family protein [Labrenzia sp. OB1]|uniref:NAD-dependent epimerase/dehydratase family protein n=1 Tax=Labrenzia sp. OB1 TaxID=1561204 RepID=UPI0007B209EE|nr:NAD-dependent epimerase/dehydratase family protein [Labrenzia sp. OB1]KZM47920.1 epimerase [Labrenzia sp. OB1]
MTRRVLVLGTSGKVGRHSSRAFEAAGWEVRRYDRGKDVLTEVAKGCDVIVNGLNPPNYHNWKTLIPQITKEVISAARDAQATVVLPGNVYHFGDQPGLWSETTVPDPVSRKGEIRLAMEREYAASGVQTIVLRAGNFIDPDSHDCIMSQIYLRDIKRNKITAAGPADTRQAMCYLPDWARAAAALAEKRAELGQFEDVPFKGHTLTALDIKNGLEKILEHELKVVRFPWWLFTLTAPFWELARELNEMRYLWNTDHQLSDTRLRRLLTGFEVTPLDTVLRKMLPK